jgi:hypothetical protein
MLTVSFVDPDPRHDVRVRGTPRGPMTMTSARRAKQRTLSGKRDGGSNDGPSNGRVNIDPATDLSHALAHTG